MKDTPEDVDRLRRAMLMSLGGEERLVMGAAMFGSAPLDGAPGGRAESGA